MSAFLFQTPVGDHRPHHLHSPDRTWPQTNCAVDLWIEIIASLGCEPTAMLAFSVGLDFEGDQFTFLKVPVHDLEALYGVQVLELAIYDDVIGHIEAQLQRHRLTLIEVDSFYLPDTRGISYRQHHGKTTIAIRGLDRAEKRLQYWHNTGCYVLDGEDFDGLFRGYAQPGVPFLPYCEFVKFGEIARRNLRMLAKAQLGRHLLSRPRLNPVGAFTQVLPNLAQTAADKGMEAVHALAFNTFRQLGANFQLFGDFLTWLGGRDAAAAVAYEISETSKQAQFVFMRACVRRQFAPLESCLDEATSAYDRLFELLVNEG